MSLIAITEIARLNGNKNETFRKILTAKSQSPSVAWRF